MAKKTFRAAAENLPIPVEIIERRIFLIRGHKVMLDRELAELYGVKPIALRQQVQRNRKRFPEDFMFHLTKTEAEGLVSQNVIPSRRSLGGYLPYVFTQEGVAMLSSVLRSERAAAVNIAIMRAFVRLREILATHKDLARRMADLEREQKAQGSQITDVFKAIQKLLEPPKDKPRRAIGFRTSKDK